MILENDRQFAACSPAVRNEILERMEEAEEILHSGVAHVGEDIGYFVVTQRGIHYTDREKAGFLKKREVSGFIDRDSLDHVYIEQSPHRPQYAHLRLEGTAGRVGSIWFEDEFGLDSAEIQAQAVAEALNAR
jgi:hypothetical protein